MDEKITKDLLKPIYSAVDRLAPTNRELINFVNSKARGEGLQRSLYKVKFIDKSEKSAMQLTGMTLIDFKKKIKEIGLSDDEIETLMNEATEIMEDAKKQVEKVYGEVRRYIVTSELRGDCIKTNFRKISTLTDAQNEFISKEIFSLALEEINKSDKHSINDIEEEFKKINHIAMTLFELVEQDNAKKAEHKHKKEPKKSRGIFDRFF
ncbi:MAG: hypothetical protein IJU55_00855 [Selenomonadaceae bacterium]|nr:hypothetical protein [Selenomonadaceae bacterium]